MKTAGRHRARLGLVGHHRLVGRNPLAAEPPGPAASLAVTETRATATDAYARQRFRPYWTLASPGIVLIRRQSLRLVKSDAERRYRDRRVGDVRETPE